MLLLSFIVIVWDICKNLICILKDRNEANHDCLYFKSGINKFLPRIGFPYFTNVILVNSYSVQVFSDSDFDVIFWLVYNSNDQN